ncbi:hypothetical protein [Psychrobacillus sp. FJAT-21963]|uniref:DUF7674 family protein n=1 Tax=Psychrobacillus sp. FJAT-21963 TaxID=1712028 RepID=UPI0006F924E1|nr:hypothetical protein [Psychrobacillus sp. FJAT-21963]KQL34415.1 hypothetical protein AN959_15580 [Psychrobacillus sp. FJAT-21963]
MEYKDLAIHFTDEFEEYKCDLQEHIEFYGETLNHVFFGEYTNYFLELIGKEKDIPKIKNLFDYLELMATSGDDDVKDLLSVTILAQLGDSKMLLKNAYKYMGSQTRKASNEIEMFWGRN